MASNNIYGSRDVPQQRGIHNSSGTRERINGIVGAPTRGNFARFEDVVARERAYIRVTRNAREDRNVFAVVADHTDGGKQSYRVLTACTPERRGATLTAPRILYKRAFHRLKLCAVLFGVRPRGPLSFTILLRAFLIHAS